MINTINLTNFKCFENQSFNIRPLTLLTGLNGMGKSSVLQSLLLLRQSFLDGVLPGAGLELNGSLVRLGAARDVFYEGAQTDEFAISIDWDDATSVEFIFQYHRDADVLKADNSDIDSQVFSRVPFTDGFHYLQAERLGPRTANAMSDYYVREHQQIGSSGEFAEHFLEVYGEKPVCDTRLNHANASNNSLRNQAQAWLGEVSPGAEFHLKAHPSMDIMNLQYSFIVGEQRSNQYRSTAVGFGITYALPVLVAILSSKPGHILLLENPEAHLHPQGQFKIGELLARAAAVGVQVLVETHSDHVLNGIRVAVHDGVLEPDAVSLNYFSRISEKGRVRSDMTEPKLDKDGRIDQWPEGFFDVWDRSLESLLRPRGK